MTFNMHSTVMTIVDTIASEDQKRRLFGEVVEGGKAPTRRHLDGCAHAGVEDSLFCAKPHPTSKPGINICG